AALCVVFAGCAKEKRGPPWFGTCFSIGRAHSIEYLYKDISRIHRSHEGLSLTTTAGDVVVVVKTVDSNQIARHAASYRRDLLDNPLIEHRDEWGTRPRSIPTVCRSHRGLDAKQLLSDLFGRCVCS